jgi:hypothetical protein
MGDKELKYISMSCLPSLSDLSLELFQRILFSVFAATHFLERWSVTARRIPENEDRPLSDYLLIVFTNNMMFAYIEG